MPNKIVTRGAWLAIALAIASPSTLLSQTAWAGAQSDFAPCVALLKQVPDFGDYESYAKRPDILTLTPQDHPELRGDWRKLRRGHLEAVAQMVGLYPDRELYFLARDSELLYDLARLYFKDDAQTLARIHLLNVSRLNMRAEHIQEYLAQEGISPEALATGKHVLFIDTGYSGTIPRVLSEYFPAELRKNLQTHLLSSSNENHPSSRVFLTSINPAAPTLNPGALHGSIVSYEHQPRFTDRSSQFMKDPHGRWHPVSPKNGAVYKDGNVSKKKARAYQEDLLAYALTQEARETFTSRLAQWRELRAMLDSKDAAALESKLKQLLADSPKDPFTEALVRDFIEVTARTLAANAPTLTLASVGLSPVNTSSSSTSNKNQLIHAHSEWKSILEEPQTGIASLITNNEWGTLGAITDVIIDTEFSKILCKALGQIEPTPQSRAFIQMLIEKADDQVPLRWLAKDTFSQPHTATMTDLLRLLIEKANQRTLQVLAASTFRQPHTATMTDLLRLLIEKADQETLQVLAEYTFSKPHTATMTDLLRLLIEKADHETLPVLAKYTFSEPHTATMTDLLRLLIEKADQKTLRWLAKYTFSKPHTQGPEFSPLRSAIKIQGSEKRRLFLLEKMGPHMSSNAVPATTDSPVTTGQPISPSLQGGQTVVTPSGLTLSVVRQVDQGKRGVVFQVKDLNSGTLYALKVARDSEPETLASIAGESGKKATLAQLGLPHAAMIEQSETFVVTEWIEGTRGDQWVDAWLKSGAPADSPEALALRALIDASVQQRAYVGDLNPKNVIVQAQAPNQPARWVIIDSGSIRTDLTQPEIIERYHANIVRRWSQKIPQAEKPLRGLLGE